MTAALLVVLTFTFMHLSVVDAVVVSPQGPGGRQEEDPAKGASGVQTQDERSDRVLCDRGDL